MIKEKVINNPNLLGVGVAQYLRVSRRCPTWDQNSIFFLEVDLIPFLGLDLIDPRSSFDLLVYTSQFCPNLNLIKDKIPFQWSSQ